MHPRHLYSFLPEVNIGVRPQYAKETAVPAFTGTAALLLKTTLTQSPATQMRASTGLLTQQYMYL